jgi:hypothetical protein
MSQDVGLRPDAYAVLFVHPTSPTELIASMYWALAGDLQKRRAAGQHVDDELHHLTRAYECVADADSRAAYDASLGFDTQPLTVRPLPPVRRSLRGRLLRRPGQRPIDLYEVMGVARNVAPEHLQPAYRIMRDQYLRLRGKRQRQLLDTLDKSYETLSSPDARDRYDGRAPEPRPDSFVDTTDAVHKPAPKAASAARPAEAASSPSIAKALRLLGRVVWFAILVVAGAIRLAYQGASSVTSKAYARWRKSPPRVARPAPVQTPLPPVVRTQRDQTKRVPAELEDKFLGRVATSVKESESHLQAPDPDSDSAKSV